LFRSQRFGDGSGNHVTHVEGGAFLSKSNRMKCPKFSRQIMYRMGHDKW
jgi:hypothetical protein